MDQADPKPVEAKLDPATIPCPTCGRSSATHLSLREAVAKGGYGRVACMNCLRTDVRRDSQ